jgi:hypothetical protein
MNRILLAWLAAAATTAAAQTIPDSPSRGRLLYETHCIACHNSQMHWRDGRIVQDWGGLVAQVRAWQERARLAWPEDDVIEVARHLNDAIYRLPRPAPGRPVALASPARSLRDRNRASTAAPQTPRRE